MEEKMEKLILPSKRSSHQFIKKAFWKLLFLITILCWSLPCEGWWYHRDFPPADPESVVAETFFSGGADQPAKGYSGLGKKSGTFTYRTLFWDGHQLVGFINSYSHHTIIFRDILPNGDYEMYLTVNASGIANHTNTFSNRAVLDYTNQLVSKHPRAPKDENIFVIVEYAMDLSIDGCPPCPIPENYKCHCGTKAQVFLYDPTKYDPTVPGKWPPPHLSDLIEITTEDYPLNKKSKIARFTTSMRFDEVRNIRLYADCHILCDYDDSIGSDGCIASVDPVITIDPDQMVEIDGVEYPANEVYEIEYSQALINAGRGVIPAIPLLLLDEETFSLGSNSFSNGAPIPVQHSLQGGNLSPPLSWSNAPANTKSFVLIMDDPDAPGGTWDHWTVYDIPAGTTSLAENAGASGSGGLPSGAVHGTNSWGHNYYQGPAPPSGTHRYYFKLYALSVSQLNPSGTSKAAIEAAMAGKILGQTQLMGTYTHID